jgi:hypothetical protein
LVCQERFDDIHQLKLIDGAIAEPFGRQIRKPHEKILLESASASVMELGKERSGGLLPDSDRQSDAALLGLASYTFDEETHKAQRSASGTPRQE